MENENEKTTEMETKKTKSSNTVENILKDFGVSTSDETKEKVNTLKEEKRQSPVLDNLSEYASEPTELHPVKKRKKYTRKNKEPETIEQKLPVSGKFLVTVTDRAMTNLLVTADRLTNKKSTLKTVDLSMSVEERDDMVPLAEEALKAMKLSSDPITAFFGGMGLLTVTKYIMLRHDK